MSQPPFAEVFCFGVFFVEWIYTLSCRIHRRFRNLVYNGLLMLKLYLVRHGEAAAAWGDHDDPGLSPLGQAQATDAAAKPAPRRRSAGRAAAAV